MMLSPTGHLDPCFDRKVISSKESKQIDDASPAPRSQVGGTLKVDCQQHNHIVPMTFLLQAGRQVTVISAAVCKRKVISFKESKHIDDASPHIQRIRFREKMEY